MPVEVAIDTLTTAEAGTFELIRQRWPRLYFVLRHQRNTDDDAMRFDKRRWLEHIYRDNSDKIVIKKASQVGITDWILCDLFSLTAEGLPYLFVMPTDSWRNDFVPRRVDKCIETVPYYSSNCSPAKKDSDKASQKVLFNTNVRFVGSKNRNNFYEFPCRVVTFDEYDKCALENVPYAFDRMAQAEKEMWRIVGNPTFSDYGIHVEYEESDKKAWHIKCEHCNEWQTLDWFVNVVTEGDTDKEYHVLDKDGRCLCRKCSKPLDRLAPGAWVAEHEGREVSGYHVSQLFGLPHEIMPKMLYDKKSGFFPALQNQTKLQRFYNNILGEIYDPKGEKITTQLLSACSSTDQWRALKNPTYVAGIDVGAVWHVNISECRDGKRRKLVAEAVKGRSEAERVCAKYNIVQGVIDANGDFSSVREFVKDKPEWLMCEYNKSERVKDFIQKDKNGRQVVHVNRTESLDTSHAAYLRKEVILPADYRDLDGGDFVKQITMPTRVSELNAKEQFSGRYIWTKGTDHHPHADNSELIAFVLSGSGQPSWAGGWV